MLNEKILIDKQPMGRYGIRNIGMTAMHRCVNKKGSQIRNCMTQWALSLYTVSLPPFVLLQSQLSVAVS
jgi:hypothetical protein